MAPCVEMCFDLVKCGRNGKGRLSLHKQPSSLRQTIADFWRDKRNLVFSLLPVYGQLSGLKVDDLIASSA